MATYRILYWQEVPSQIQRRGRERRRQPAVAAKFMERIDALAAERGLEGTDDYLAQWRWSEEEQREGSAQDVAQAICRELEALADW